MRLNGLPEQINRLRDRSLAVVDTVDASATIKLLVQSNVTLRQKIDAILRTVRSDAVRRDCSPKIRVAFIGESGSSKSTWLKDCLPDVEERGWLVADTTDTTSQALHIEYAPPGSQNSESVEIGFCSLDEITRLVEDESIRGPQKEDGILVERHVDKVVVNGEKCTSLRDPQFPRKLELPQIPDSYTVPADCARKPQFISALTTKVPSSAIDGKPLITVAGIELNALVLRAIVKNVRIRSNYARLFALAPEHREILESIIFVDTPGLGTAASDKDEVLKYALGIKSNEIARRMYDADELDIIVQVVLVGRQSNFHILWHSLENGRDSATEFSQRFFLLMTGFNQFFENGCLCDRHSRRVEPDHFHIALKTNVLEQLGPTGVHPARIAFVDSPQYLKLQGKSYRNYYSEKVDVIRGWTRPGGFGASTLQSLGAPDAFASNFEAVMDENDAGGGHFVRSLAELVDERGPFLILRRQVKRTGLLDAIRTLHELLKTLFRSDGSIAASAAADILRKAFDSLTNGSPTLDPHRVEDFAKAIDSQIDQVVRQVAKSSDHETWLQAAFESIAFIVADKLGRDLADTEKPPLRRFFEERVPTWAKRWGIADARFDPVSPDSQVLATSAIRVLARQMIYDTHEALEQGKLAPQQDSSDREKIKALIQEVTQLREEYERLCFANSLS